MRQVNAPGHGVHHNAALIIVATAPAAGIGHHGPPSVCPETTRDNLGTTRSWPPLSDFCGGVTDLFFYFLEFIKHFRIGIFNFFFLH